jgi:ABC-type uncharacterized transport system permease subunit
VGVITLVENIAQEGALVIGAWIAILLVLWSYTLHLLITLLAGRLLLFLDDMSLFFL